jgi:2,4-dienoyl-CoA reductase-like NADH-dependent reductase (Old Yellow Enzyme family)/mono/diheme cytochrome c family protein
MNDENSPQSHSGSSANLILEPLVFPGVRNDNGRLTISPGAGLRVKNRIFRSSISGRFDNDNGSGSETRIRWEEKFARGGVGAIISSFVPVLMNGRILVNYATIHDDKCVEFWTELVQRVHDLDCKYIIQLSHSGRQKDVGGMLNLANISRTATDTTDTFHGLLAQRMTDKELDGMIEAFAHGARRARESGADGVELHASHGYLFTQFLSSAINGFPATHRYGGPIENRAQFLVDVIAAIRREVGWDYHVQAKLNILDRNRALWPLEWKDGNTMEECLKVFEIAENAGVNGLHVSAGSTFPHPLVPPGGFPADELANTYGVMASSGTRSLQNLLLFHFPLLRPLFTTVWNRVKTEFPVEGVTHELSHVVWERAHERALRRGDENTRIPILNTGGYQDGALIRKVISDHDCDAVAIARPLIANNDLVNTYFANGRDLPDRPCTFCNRCLVNAPANPLACYDQTRFGSREAMLAEAESVFKVQLPVRDNQLCTTTGEPVWTIDKLPVMGEQKTKHRDGVLIDKIYSSPVERALVKQWKRWLWIALAILLLWSLLGLVARFTGDRPVSYEDGASHFKYGSIGAEPGGGNPLKPVGGNLPPYQIFAILPDLFPDKLPGGYASVGLIFEKDEKGNTRDLPIGVSRRQRLGLDMVGLNCAICHVGTLRTSPNGPQQIVVGMPAHQLDLQNLLAFVLNSVLDDRFTPANVVGHVERKFGKLSWAERTLLSDFTVPSVRDTVVKLRAQAGAMLINPTFVWGAGRVDTFNPYKVLQFHWPVSSIPPEQLAAASDYPSLWNQAARREMNLHWDGNNSSLAERNLSAGLGAGITPVTADFPAIDRVSDFVQNLPAPTWPADLPLDREAAARGAVLYQKTCAVCHDFGAPSIGKTVPLPDIGTDPARFLAYTIEFSAQQNTLFPNSPRRFKHFHKTNGYVNQPLDGLWARAPYLHNGSVPTLVDLLEPVEKRPKRFYRGDDVYDAERVGFRHDLPEANGRKFFDYDTTRLGNSNAGHLYGTDLPAEAKHDLIEYLKTL